MIRSLYPSLVPVGSHGYDATISAATVLSRPAGFSPDGVLLQAIDQDVSFTIDGTTPTASIGFVIKAGADPVLIDMSGGQTLTVIEVTATATVQYQWVNYGGH
jgi:hypothetical protein